MRSNKIDRAAKYTSLISMYLDGAGVDTIADTCGITKSSVYEIVNEFNRAGREYWIRTYETLRDVTEEVLRRLNERALKEEYGCTATPEDIFERYKDEYFGGSKEEAEKLAGYYEAIFGEDCRFREENNMDKTFTEAFKIASEKMTVQDVQKIKQVYHQVREEEGRPLHDADLIGYGVPVEHINLIRKAGILGPDNPRGAFLAINFNPNTRAKQDRKDHSGCSLKALIAAILNK